MLATPKCYKRKCILFIGVKNDDDTEETEYNYCKIFPDGIPHEIAHGNKRCLQERRMECGNYALRHLLG
jgi:hypothetical protein